MPFWEDCDIGSLRSRGLAASTRCLLPLRLLRFAAGQKTPRRPGLSGPTRRVRPLESGPFEFSPSTSAPFESGRPRLRVWDCIEKFSLPGLVELAVFRAGYEGVPLGLR